MGPLAFVPGRGGRDLAKRALSPRPPRARFAIQAVDKRKNRNRDEEEDQGRVIGRCVIPRLNLIKDVDGNRPRNAGDIPADHQHNTEFA